MLYQVLAGRPKNGATLFWPTLYIIKLYISNVGYHNNRHITNTHTKRKHLGL